MSNTRPVAIVQARLGSTRLPGKVLADIEGQPLIVRQMERMQRATTIAGVVVAIPSGPENDPLEHLCRERQWACLRGPERDVLSRYAYGASVYQADPVVRMTMDCPLIDHGVIDGVVRMFLEGGDFDYVSNNLEKTFPHGLDVECLSAAALFDADQRADDAFDREHVTEWIRRHQDRPYRLGNLRYPIETLSPDMAAILVAARLTVDYPEDLELVRTIYREFRDLDYITTADVVDFLRRCPEVMTLNEHRALEHAQMLSGHFEPISEEAREAMRRDTEDAVERGKEL